MIRRQPPSEARTTLADKVRIDLSRYGIPRIDEHKLPIPGSEGASAGPHEEDVERLNPAYVDTLENSRRILTTPPPREARSPQVKQSVTGRDSASAARRDSVMAGKRDTLSVPRQERAPAAPSKPPPR